MMFHHWSFCALLLFAIPVLAEVTPLPRAHSHNDYMRQRPLEDALGYGFCSIEADIWLVNGDLLVAHDAEDITPERTLQGLYLDPLLARVQSNGGRVYPNGPEVILLVDIKSDGLQTYPVLREMLKGYSDMLTEFTHELTTPKAVRVVVSGDVPREMVLMDSPRLAAVDGRLEHLESDANMHQIPLISDSWTKHFTWRGEGEFPAEEAEKLRAIVEKAHSRGQMVRFWAIPRPESTWPVLYDAGVDLLNADNLAALQNLLLSRQAPPAAPAEAPASAEPMVEAAPLPEPAPVEPQAAPPAPEPAPAEPQAAPPAPEPAPAELQAAPPAPEPAPAEPPAAPPAPEPAPAEPPAAPPAPEPAPAEPQAAPPAPEPVPAEPLPAPPAPEPAAP